MTYLVCTQPDKELFFKQCAALERHIPELSKGDLLEDVDGSLCQEYEKDGKRILVHNSEYIGELYVETQLNLQKYFPNARPMP